jgi:hypothetical protein
VVWKYHEQFADAIRSNSASAGGQRFVVSGDGERCDVLQRVQARMLQLVEALGGGA